MPTVPPNYWMPLLAVDGSSAATLAAVLALIGTLGAKIVDRWWNRADKRHEEEASVRQEHNALRDELRKQLAAEQARNVALQREVDDWRGKYYAEVQNSGLLKIQLQALSDRLTAAQKECEACRQEINNLTALLHRRNIRVRSDGPSRDDVQDPP
jgi:hypothetical protein